MFPSAAWLEGLFWAAADDSSVTSSRESPGIKETARTNGSRAGSTGTALPTLTSWFPVHTPVCDTAETIKMLLVMMISEEGSEQLFSSCGDTTEEVTSWRTPEPGYKSVLSTDEESVPPAGKRDV